MYYAAFLLFIALTVFLVTPVFNTPNKREDKIQKLDTTEVGYTPPDREPPKRTQGGASRLKNDD